MAYATAVYVAAAVIAAAGAGTAAYSTAQQAKTAEKVGNYNAKLAENEAIQTEMDARENTRRKRSEHARLLSSQRAKFAMGGAVEAGTPLQLMAETAGLLELDALDNNLVANRQAALLRSQARSDRAAGAAARSAGNIGATATLLNGAASIGSSYVSFSQAGGFKGTGKG